MVLTLAVTTLNFCYLGIRTSQSCDPAVKSLQNLAVAAAGADSEHGAALELLHSVLQLPKVLKGSSP